MNKCNGFIIEYMINSPCNLSCPFCYGPDPKLKQSLSKDLKLKLIRNFKKNNVKKIIIAGGEPTLEKDLIDVCKLSNSLGIGISLQTNGFYLNVLRDILEYIDFLALPLDGIYKQSQLKMRTSINHLENTTKALELVTSYNLIAKKRIKIKIGTVLSKFNIDEIDGIADFLSNYQIDIWKLYEIRKRGNGEKVHEKMTIDTSIATEIINRLKEKHSNFPILFASDILKNDSYVIVDPDASCYVINKNNTEKFGNLLNKDNSFNSKKFKKILNISDIKSIELNTEKSFPDWGKNT